LLVGLGGMLGALARYGLSAAWPAGVSAFPWATLTINLTGSLVLGVVMSVLTHRSGRLGHLRIFLATGFLGGYTTFSTFAVQSIQLIRHSQTVSALGYMAISTLGGLALAFIGLRLGAALTDGQEGLDLAEEEGAS
jgi:CrcB protein